MAKFNRVTTNTKVEIICLIPKSKIKDIVHLKILLLAICDLYRKGMDLDHAVIEVTNDPQYYT